MYVSLALSNNTLLYILLVFCNPNYKLDIEGRLFSTRLGELLQRKTTLCVMLRVVFPPKKTSFEIIYSLTLRLS